MADEETTGWPAGIAYVDRVGWEEDEEHGRRFTALLVFPTGAPDLTAAVVWRKRPVKIEVQNGSRRQSHEGRGVLG